MVGRRIVLLLSLHVVLYGIESEGFAPLTGSLQERRKWVAPTSRGFISSSCLHAAKRKRKRRRKQPPGGATAVPDPVKVSLEKIEGLEEEDDALDEDEEEVTLKSSELKVDDTETFDLEPDGAITMGIQDDDSTTRSESADKAIPLPDIKDALRKKKMEEEMARIQEEEEQSRDKIKRSDKEAFTKLLERDPYADMEDSFFEEEEYGTASALLGERAEPFLGIPAGPLQVGHFIGALGIALMAFVEYPGFPLTNLPTPLRDSLKGGLLFVYIINVVLAVLAAFKAGERGQPVPLWVAKTVSVGGLAYDQLTQLPTLEEAEAAEAKKGKVPLKKNKSRR